MSGQRRRRRLRQVRGGGPGGGAGWEGPGRGGGVRLLDGISMSNSNALFLKERVRGGRGSERPWRGFQIQNKFQSKREAEGHGKEHSQGIQAQIQNLIIPVIIFIACRIMTNLDVGSVRLPWRYTCPIKYILKNIYRYFLTAHYVPPLSFDLILSFAFVAFPSFPTGLFSPSSLFTSPFVFVSDRLSANSRHLSYTKSKKNN